MTIQENISLLPYNTFRMDVKARYLAQYESIDELIELLNKFQDTRRLFIGEGSNLLFTGDFDGLVCQSKMCRAAATKETEEDVWIEVQGGLKLDLLIEQVADMQLYGLENLSYIPGQVGAGAVQNVGAYGREIKDCIEQVNAWDLQTMQSVSFTREECHYAYRDSLFKREGKNRYIITSVVFRLSKTPQLHLEYGNLKEYLQQDANPQQVRQTIIQIRKKKLPEVSELGSAGSFFKNPIVSADKFNNLKEKYKDIPSYPVGDNYKIPAAWLIEQCGWKGKTVGGAKVYDRQPLVIVNTGNATSSDICSLAKQIVDSVYNRFQITIDKEVEYV